MMTREEVQDIIQYCHENKVSFKKRFEELGIRPGRFYDAKRKYLLEDQQNPKHTGEFIQLPSTGNFVPAALPPARTQKTQLTNSIDGTESYMTVELRNVSGSAMIIQGNMTPIHLREIINGMNHV